MEQPENIVNIMINMPEYFNNWLFINDFKFKRHSIKENKVHFESKMFSASINANHFCCIECKYNREIIFVFKIPKDRVTFSIFKGIMCNFLGVVTEEVG